MADRFSKYSLDLDSPAVNAFTVTPNDSTVFSNTTRYVYVGTGGNLKVMFSDKNNANNVVTFTGVPTGTTLRIRVQRIYSGNTTASNIIGMY